MTRRRHRSYEVCRAAYVTSAVDALRDLPDYCSDVAAEPPSLRSIFEWSRADDWPGQRDRFRERTAERQINAVSEVVTSIERRQAQLGVEMQALAFEALARLDAGQLRAHEVSRLAKEGVWAERLALGLAVDRADLRVALAAKVIRSFVTLGVTLFSRAREVGLDAIFQEVDEEQFPGLRERAHHLMAGEFGPPLDDDLRRICAELGLPAEDLIPVPS